MLQFVSDVEQLVHVEFDINDINAKFVALCKETRLTLNSINFLPKIMLPYNLTDCLGSEAHGISGLSLHTGKNLQVLIIC